MKNVTLFLLILLLGTRSETNAQIGEVSIGLASPGHVTVGSVRTIGVSTLPVCRPREFSSCPSPSIYRFTGNGAWSIEANWLGSRIPPALLPPGDIIIITPEAGGECLLNVPQTIASKAFLDLPTGKRLRILASLTFLH